MAELIAASADRPGGRRLDACTALTIRHFDGDATARAALVAARLPWPLEPGELAGADPFLARRHPNEIVAVGLAPESLAALLPRLAAGRSETAVAIDLSQALAVFELHGARLDAWLSRLVDASAIARTPGRASWCRLADVAATLLRIDTERVLILVDRSVAGYLARWLEYAHVGAFADAAISRLGPPVRTLS